MNLNFGHMAATDKQALHCSVKLDLCISEGNGRTQADSE